VQNDIQQLGEDAASQKRVNPVERQVEAIERMFDISLISHVTTFIVEQDVALGYPVAARESRSQRSNNQSRCFSLSVSATRAAMLSTSINYSTSSIVSPIPRRRVLNSIVSPTMSRRR
jgi:hypothetical protein